MGEIIQGKGRLWISDSVFPAAIDNRPLKFEEFEDAYRVRKFL
jgi:excinuclease UvrABC helicase subunit UvrB